MYSRWWQLCCQNVRRVRKITVWSLGNRTLLYWFIFHQRLQTFFSFQLVTNNYVIKNHIRYQKYIVAYTSISVDAIVSLEIDHVRSKTFSHKQNKNWFTFQHNYFLLAMPTKIWIFLCFFAISGMGISNAFLAK